MLTLECLQWTFRSRRFIPHSFRSFVGYLAKRIFNLTFFSSTIFWPFSAFHHLAHNLVISFEMLGWLRLAAHYARSVMCQMHVKGNMSEPFPTLLFWYPLFFIASSSSSSSSWYIQALNVLDSTAPSVWLWVWDLVRSARWVSLLSSFISLSLSLCLSLGGWLSFFALRQFAAFD